MILGDQAEKLRRMVREMRPHARVVAVTSGKGGVGKTNVAVNLAVMLARGHSKRVALVDADLGLANVDLVLDLQPRWNLSHLLSGRKELEEIIAQGPEGIEVVPGASGLSRLANLADAERHLLVDQLSRLERRADVCIIDTGAGIGDTVVAMAASADDCLVVTTPEPPSIADAYATIKILSRTARPPRLHLLVNMVGGRREARQVYERISAVARRFLGADVRSAGYIFCDGHVARAVRRRRPFVTEFPNSQATWCMRQVAENLLRGSAEPVSPVPAHGFFHRVAGLFGTVP